MKKSNLLLAILTIVLAAAYGAQQILGSDGVEARVALDMNQHGALLLDVREPEEYSAIHAPNAKLIPLGQLSSRLAELADYKDKPIVVMCRSGHRSARAVSLLREAGYSQVSNIKGGINAWEGDGLEVIRK